MNDIPVIFIHIGFQDYLFYTIKQACKYNKVILIGTENKLTQEENLTFYDIKPYLYNCNEFTKLYEHKSTLGKDYELFCFQRWFILNMFMKVNNIDKVFYVDSDVMLYTNITNEFNKFEQFDMTLLHRSAPISSFFTKRGLNNFCKFVYNTFNNKEDYIYKKIVSHYDIRQACNLTGGVCDMTYFDFFHQWDEQGGPGRVGEMMTIIDGTTYDHNINVPDQDFEYDGKHKVVKMNNGIPYVYNTRLKQNIKFNTLHFQAGAKKMIPDFC